MESGMTVHQRPWHGLGTRLATGASLSEWQRSAGLDWEILEGPVQYAVAHELEISALRTFEGRRVLYRSDTLAPLSVVSRNYRIVQPRQILEFYRDFVDRQGYTLEAAGCLRGGRSIWALADIHDAILLPGQDIVQAYLLLATSCDGTTATTIRPTSIRVVCANTLHATAYGDAAAIRIPHSRVFDPADVQEQLRQARHRWREFSEMAQLFARTQLSAKAAVLFLERVVGTAERANPRSGATLLGKMVALYAGGGKGSRLASAHETLWGAVNAVAEYVDHGRVVRSETGRLSSIWFGSGAQLKEEALAIARSQVWAASMRRRR